MIAVGLILFFAASLPADSDVWPGFLGTGASSLSVESIPLEWSPEEIAWTAATIGYGQSSPVIWSNQIFATSVDGPRKETLVVTSLDLKTGNANWTWKGTSTYPEKNSVYISRAAPTPVVDGNGIYAYFESGDIVALSHSGEELWKQDLTNRYGKPTNNFGLSGSPVQTDSHIVILVDDPESAYIVALQKSDGEVAWKTDRDPRRSWSSPGLIVVDGAAQIVCSSAGSVDGYDPQTGKQLWTFADVGGNTAASPMDSGNGTFLIAASPGRRGENTDSARKSNGLMKVQRTDDGYSADFVWRSNSATPSFASPIVHKDYAYWINRVGALYCVDAQTGKTEYTRRVSQSSWATPVGLGNHVFLFGKDGTTTVIKSGPTFEIVSENRLWAEGKPPANNIPAAEETDAARRQSSAMFSKPTLYGSAIVNGAIVLRTGSQVFCIRK